MEPNQTAPQAPQSAPPPPSVPQMSDQIPSVKKRFPKVLIFVIIFFLLAASGVAGFFIYRNSNTNPEQVACTMEAMICPDGSSVGRTGPNCEFSPCPTTATSPTSTPLLDTSNWNTYSNPEYNYEFKYPPEFYSDNPEGFIYSENNYAVVFGDSPSQPNPARFIHTGIIFNNTKNIEEFIDDPQYHYDLLGRKQVGTYTYWVVNLDDRSDEQFISYMTPRSNNNIFWFRLQPPFYDQSILETIAGSLKFTN